MTSEKILSREEMDALLAGSPADTEHRLQGRARGVVKPYDFKRPRLFTSEHLRTLERMHSEFAEEAGADLAVQFAIPVKVVFSGFAEPSLQEHLGAQAADNALFLCAVEPGNAPALVDVAGDLARALIDRLLGGEGAAPAAHALTEVELGILGVFVDRWLAKYRTPWALRIPGFTMKAVSAVRDPQRPPKALAGHLEGLCLRAAFEVKVGTQVGSVSVCMLQYGIKPFIGAFCGGGVQGTEPPPDRSVTMDHVGEVSLPVCAYLGNVHIRVDDFMRLQRGDVIALGDLENPARVMVGGAARFQARLGRVKERLAVQLTGIVPAAGGRCTS